MRGVSGSSDQSRGDAPAFPNSTPTSKDEKGRNVLATTDISRRSFVKLGAFAAATAAMSGSVGSNLVHVEPAVAAETGET